MCVNVRCSHKRGAALGVGRGGKVARGSLVSGKQAKAVVPRKWPQLFHSFIHSFARCLICPFQCCLYVCVCGLPVRVGSGCTVVDSVSHSGIAPGASRCHSTCS